MNPCMSTMYAGSHVFISQHTPAWGGLGYKLPTERWSPVQSIEKTWSKHGCFGKHISLSAPTNIGGLGPNNTCTYDVFM